jgi:hypothetical protein
MRTIYILSFILFLPIHHLIGQSNRYALLVNTAYNREFNQAYFYNELTRIFNFLINDQNYSENNIFIYSADGIDTAKDYRNGSNYFNSDPDLDLDGDDDITGPSDFSTITSKLNDLDFLGNNDFLFVYLTGPLYWEESTTWGDPFREYPGLTFWNSDLRTNDCLAPYISNLSPANLCIIDARNYDGLDVDDYDGDNRYIIKSMTYTVLDEPFSPIATSNYGEYFLDALIGKKSNGDLVYADFDESGVTTINEARNYAGNLVSTDYSDYYYYNNLKASNISLNGYEGCQSNYRITPGVVSSLENYSDCNVFVKDLVVTSGGQLIIDAHVKAVINSYFVVENGGTLRIE